MIRVAFLTGRSDPRSCALSPAQEAFLARITGPYLRPCALNFPYTEGLRGHRRQPLWIAGLRNGRDYILSRRASFVSHHGLSIARLIDSADHTIVLAGSCGLELFNNARLSRSLLDRSSVFAFGPVARKAPDCRFFSVQGRGDWLSRHCFGPADRTVDSGHLAYLENKDVGAHCGAFVRATIESLGVMAATADESRGPAPLRRRDGSGDLRSRRGG